MNAAQAIRFYNSLPPGQSMGLQEFVKQAVALTGPDQFHLDTTSLLTMREIARAERARIERAVAERVDHAIRT